MKPVRVLLLGATGSIGQQTLDVLRDHPDDFELVGISAGHDLDGLKAIIDEFDTVRYAGLSALSKAGADTLSKAGNVKWFGSAKQMEELAAQADYDLAVNATVGFRGLAPTLAALARKKDVALANKESLVCGGELVKQVLEESGASLRPIDSEHSAIWQCLQGNEKSDVRRLIITASGGSLRDLSRDELQDITPSRALAHPSWSMGRRITIDSATMVNKGFEVIEAHYLFDLPYSKIDTVLHPQSIVHSMVEYNDGAVMAQMGSADMRLPIQYALYGPRRPHRKEDKPVDFTKALTLNFKEMDTERFPMLALAIETGKKKGNAPCVFNAADEEAVELFLNGKIRFLQIEEAIADALQAIEYIEQPTLHQLEETDRMTREYVRTHFE